MNKVTALENSIQFINDAGGFTVVGWYKRGVINDKSINAYQKMNNDNDGNTAAKYNTNKEDKKFDTGLISYHITSINTQKYEFIDPTSKFGRDFFPFKLGC